MAFGPRLDELSGRAQDLLLFRAPQPHSSAGRPEGNGAHHRDLPPRQARRGASAPLWRDQAFRLRSDASYGLALSEAMLLQFSHQSRWCGLTRLRRLPSISRNRRTKPHAIQPNQAPLSITPKHPPNTNQTQDRTETWQASNRRSGRFHRKTQRRCSTSPMVRQPHPRHFARQQDY